MLSSALLDGDEECVFKIYVDSPQARVLLVLRDELKNMNGRDADAKTQSDLDLNICSRYCDNDLL